MHAIGLLIVEQPKRGIIMYYNNDDEGVGQTFKIRNRALFVLELQVTIVPQFSGWCNNS